MPDARSHLLIFEPDHRGHVVEWIQHILATKSRGRHLSKLTIVVAQEAADMILGNSTFVDAGIEVLPLTSREYALCNHRRLFISGMARWWVARRYLARTGAGRILFLALDHLSLPLGIGLSFGGPIISGILFRPSVHYAEFGAARQSFSNRIRDLRKHVLYGRMLVQPSIQVIFSLDPYFPDYAGRRYVAGVKVLALADPIYPAPEPAPSELAQANSIPPDRKVFFLFGEITERKGILQLLTALSLLDETVCSQTAILMAGRIDSELRDRVARGVAAARRDRPTLWLRVDDRRLTPGEIAALVKRADFILAPYQNFVGSSGVLLWAAQFAKPVITQDYGLVGRLTRDFDLGLTVDTTNPHEIASAMEFSIRKRPPGIGNAKGMATYAHLHDCQSFGQELLRLA